MRTRAALQRIQREVPGAGASLSAWPCGRFWSVWKPRGAYPFEAAHAQVRKGVERIGIPFVDLLPDPSGA